VSNRLGARLKVVREQLGYTRSYVARQAGIDASMLFRIENSERSSPTFETVRKLAHVLGVSLDSLSEQRPASAKAAAEARHLLDVDRARGLIERAILYLGGSTQRPLRSKAAPKKNVK
jgi:transcriptional regulator with XRE-family HTH domain